MAQSVVSGTCDPRFDEVRREFERNFAERDEVGAGVHVVVGGETVVDLWGGTTTRNGDAPWTADTMSVAWSCTKGATAMCAHILADRGELDLEAPVSDYWPEFASNGKEQATVRMMLDHSVGVAAIRDKLPDGAVHDWDVMCDALAMETPWWEPGTRNGYHMLTFGWTVGELVRRVSGRSLGTFFREEVAEPYGADFHIGLAAEDEERVAPVIGYRPDRDEQLSRFTQALLADRDGLQGKGWLNMGGFDANSRATHAAEIGGGGGIGSARGLARMYAPFAVGGDGLVGADTLTRMGEVAAATDCDAMLLLPTRFALGFMKSMDNRRRANTDTDSAVLSGAAFGHVGAGGSIGFTDPAEGMSFGYVMNRMGAGILLNDRGQSLVDATYRALGYRTNDPGIWVR